MSQTETLQKRFAAALMPNYGVPPLAISRGQGCRVWDADGREYLDPVSYTHLTLPTILLV